MPERLSLADRLRQRIKRQGPITFRDWMEAALYDSQDGYYCRQGRERWGRAGDYRTSPERSPLFAATFARYFARLYESLNSPVSWTIVECGAGAGYFAEVLLATLSSRFPPIFSATSYVIDEASAGSSAAAQARLARFAERIEFRRLDSISSIDNGVVFSNELLDAFPLHRVTMRGGKLCEMYVGLDQGGRFEWTVRPLSDSRLSEYFEFAGVHLADGQTAEVNLDLEDWLTNVAGKLRQGYVVTVDYGAEAAELYKNRGPVEGTLRAFRRHQFANDVLADPGEQDITATVSWPFVRRVGEKLGLETIEFQGQDQFLLGAGLLEELERRVAETADEALKLQLRTSAREMILPNGMAASFQVLVQKSSPGETARTVET